MKQATLVFLIRGDEVLLAMKKRGFGQGRWNGVGGKPQAGEDILSAAIRESQEEIGVTPSSLQEVARLNFYFPKNPDWDQQVIVYLSTRWVGEPLESEEMSPRWFNKSELPFDSMWSADSRWIPLILQGQKITGDISFGDNDTTLDFDVRPVEKFD